MQHVETFESTQWRRWMREFGQQERRIREFLGLSQAQVAEAAGVSQGSVSRLEGGRGLGTPMVVILRINLAMSRELRRLDPEMLNDDLRRALAIQEALSPPGLLADAGASPAPLHADLDDLVGLYRRVPAGQRGRLLAILRAAVQALGSDEPAREHAQHDEPGRSSA